MDVDCHNWEAEEPLKSKNGRNDPENDPLVHPTSPDFHSELLAASQPHTYGEQTCG